jgi:small subunit ribosomal protein S1
MEKKDLSKDRQSFEEHREDKLEQLAVGQFVFGKVVDIKQHGAIIDIGGVDGLLHVSDLSWSWINDPGDVLDLGDKIVVKIKEIDFDAGTISLDCKSLLTNPWPLVKKRLRVGDLVEGIVTTVTDFGVFVKLPMGAEGLVHNSQIEIDDSDMQRKEYHRGTIVLVRVISIEPDQKRIGLSTRQISTAERLDWRIRKQENGNAARISPLAKGVKLYSP